MNGDWQYFYATATDGTVYHKPYDGTTWGDWQKVSGDVGSDYEPYAISWGDKEQVFWCGTDGQAYWSRYDGTAWSEAKALPGDYQIAYTPYAAGYDDSLYTFAVDTAGKPVYNVFDGDAWSGWAGGGRRLTGEVRSRTSTSTTMLCRWCTPAPTVMRTTSSMARMAGATGPIWATTTPTIRTSTPTTTSCD